MPQSINSVKSANSVNLSNVKIMRVEMAWAVKRPANEPLTGLFSGPLTAQFYFLFLMAAWPSGSELRFYHGRDRKVDGSIPTQASLLRPWIRCFTTIISAWWNLTSSKLKKSEVKFKRKTRKQGQLLSESGFVLCIAASVAFS